MRCRVGIGTVWLVVTLLSGSWLASCGDDGNDPPTAPTPAVLAVSPAVFTFPDTAYNTLSLTTAVFTVTNSGGVAVDLSSVSSTNPLEFPFSTTCVAPGVLASQASCTLAIQFRPRGGLTMARVTIATSNAGTGSIDLTGTGQRPQLDFTPPTLSFQVPLYSTSPIQSVSVTNTGNIPVPLWLVEVYGLTGISIPMNSCGGLAINGQIVSAPGSVTLQPGASCSMEVTYTSCSVGTAAGGGTIRIRVGNGFFLFFISATGTTPSTALPKPSFCP